MTHEIVVDQLERHLSGKASQAFYNHLDSCPGCRSEVAQMETFSRLISELRPDSAAPGGETVPQPSPGFYNRVSFQIVEREQKRTWGLFSPGAVFFRRVAFASLALLAGLGSLLLTREASFAGPDAASIMAQHDPAAIHPEGSDRDRMLVTLATYRQ